MFLRVAIVLKSAIFFCLVSMVAPELSPAQAEHSQPGSSHVQNQDGPDLRSKRKQSHKKSGLDLPRRPGGDLAPGSPGRRQRLQLPPGQARRRPATDGLGNSDTPGVSEAVPVAQAPPLASSAQNAASAVFEELKRVSQPPSSLARKALDSLLAMGDEGLVAARLELSSNVDVVLLTAARVLLRGGTDADHGLVQTRLQAKVPAASAKSLMGEFVSRDPVRASPEFLVSLLDHPTGMLRSAAQHELAGQLSTSLLPVLARALEARRADTRLRALDLVNAIEDPGVLLLLVARLGDSSAKVCARSAELLAARPPDEVGTILRDRAFEGSSALDAGRGGAYALLALVQLEARSGQIQLGDADVPRLLDGLASNRPLQSVASAIALAGVGFRSPHSSEYAWLDLEVPHALIRWGSGAEFHGDFSSVNELALHRVGLLSGEPFGLDGLAWRQWWSNHAGQFHARRAVVPVSRLEAAALSIVLRTGYGAEDALAIVGPAAPDSSVTGIGRVVYVDVARCESIFDLLEREGVFGASRLPASASGVQRAHLLDIRIGGRGKLLAEPRTGDDAWFVRLSSTLEALATDNLWQRWFDPLKYSTQREFWAAEKSRFAEKPESVSFVREEVELLFERLEAFSSTTLVDDREDEVLQALVERYTHAGVSAPEDFARLTKLLDREAFHGQRAEGLLSLALLAAREGANSGGVEDEISTQATGRVVDEIDPSRAEDLLAILVQEDGPRVPEALARVVEAGGLMAARSAAVDTLASLRSIAAEPLAKSDTPSDHSLLAKLLDDPEEQVEAAACRAIGAHDLREFGAELAVRARLGGTAVRVAALDGLVALKHPEALDQLRNALFDPELELQRAAARGIAELGDPSAGALLARLLARGPNSPLFATARQGLASLGADATEDLLVLANSGIDEVRRAAALLLSRLGEAEAFPLLLTGLTIHREDRAVAAELAILSCVDFRNSEDPVAAWWGWWDLVVQSDSRAWIAAAAEVARKPAPPLTSLSPKTNLEGALFFLAMLSDSRPHVVERVRRELSRILGEELILSQDEGERLEQRTELEHELRSMNWEH